LDGVNSQKKQREEKNSGKNQGNTPCMKLVQLDAQRAEEGSGKGAA